MRSRRSENSARPGAASFSFDESATRTRIARLESYLRRSVMKDGRFTCVSEAACRTSIDASCSFHPGQAPHVGSHYDVVASGVPLRVLVIGMSYGTDHEIVSLTDRREMVLRVAEPGRSLNPHMSGTALALRAIFDLPSGDLDIANEYLGAPCRETHVFNAFALVNCLLCSARRQGKKDHGTTTMRRHCRTHLLETLAILQPTLLIVQGAPPAAAIRDLIAPEIAHLGVLRAGAVAAIACTFTHPSARGNDGWRSPRSGYLREVVLPTIAEARRRLGISTGHRATPTN